MSGTQVTEPEEISAGGVVFRRRAGEVEVVLAEQIDRNTDARTVRLPKGHLEAGESLEAAALREVEEEVGLLGRIIARLDDVTYVFWNRADDRQVPKRVVFFLIEHESGEAHASDGEMETVFWTGFEEAIARLSFAGERAVVAQAQALLASSPPPGP